MTPCEEMAAAMPKRPLNFALFAGDKYYPGGGWHDFKGSYNSLITAIEAVAGMSCDWWQVVDMSTGQIIHTGTRGY